MEVIQETMFMEIGMRKRKRTIIMVVGKYTLQGEGKLLNHFLVWSIKMLGILLFGKEKPMEVFKRYKSEGCITVQISTRNIARSFDQFGQMVDCSFKN